MDLEKISDYSWEQIKKDVADAQEIVEKNWNSLREHYPMLDTRNYSQTKNNYSVKPVNQ